MIVEKYYYTKYPFQNHFDSHKLFFFLFLCLWKIWFLFPTKFLGNYGFKSGWPNCLWKWVSCTQPTHFKANIFVSVIVLQLENIEFLGKRGFEGDQVVCGNGYLICGIHIWRFAFIPLFLVFPPLGQIQIMFDGNLLENCLRDSHFKIHIDSVEFIFLLFFHLKEMQILFATSFLRNCGLERGIKCWNEHPWLINIQKGSNLVLKWYEMPNSRKLLILSWVFSLVWNGWHYLHPCWNTILRRSNFVLK